MKISMNICVDFSAIVTWNIAYAPFLSVPETKCLISRTSKYSLTSKYAESQERAEDGIQAIFELFPDTVKDLSVVLRSHMNPK